MKKRKAKKVSPPPPQLSLKPGRPEDTAEPEKAFDFGGLPPRDLKKNLGCG
jgi:hypothetical protein